MIEMTFVKNKEKLFFLGYSLCIQKVVSCSPNQVGLSKCTSFLNDFSEDFPNLRFFLTILISISLPASFSFKSTFGIFADTDKESFMEEYTNVIGQDYTRNYLMSIYLSNN